MGQTAGAVANGLSRLDAVLGRLTDGGSVPGLSVVVCEGREVTASSAGLADISSDRAATQDTVYLWFSMTKIVTATAVMVLVDSGALRLDDPVRRFVPAFPAARGGAEVEVRHLLSHSSGLPNPMPVRWVHGADTPGADPHEFAVRLLAKNRRLRSAAGARASYSNLGYIALGEVIAAASGEPYERFIRGRILEPLALHNTGFDYAGVADGAIATGYQRRVSPMTPLFRVLLPRGIMGPAAGRFVSFNRFLVDGPAYGGLVGTARDAARFMAVHLNQGEAHGVRLLSPESTAAMQTLHARGRRLDAGYGWLRRGDDRGQDEFWEHLGGGGGFWSMMRIYPDRALGVLAMGNSTGYDHDAIARAALEDRR